MRKPSQIRIENILKTAKENDFSLHFVSYLAAEYSRSGVLLSKIRSIHRNTRFSKVKRPYVCDIFRLIHSNKTNKIQEIFVVMSPNQMLVIFLKILGAKRIVLDAGWTLTESAISQNKSRLKVFKLVKNYLIDFFAMHLSNLVLLESTNQIRNVERKFKLPSKKLIRSFTGFNEMLYQNTQSRIPHEFAEIQSLYSKPFIFFRGKNNEESGLEFVSLLSQELKAFRFVIATNSRLEQLSFAENTMLISRHLSNSEIKWIYERATICLGQLSNNKRLQNTIPHKAFEASYFGIPYVTTDTPAMRELLPKSKHAIYIKNLEIGEVGEKITYLMNNQDFLEKTGYDSQRSYNSLASQDVLGRSLLKLVKNLLV